jgi:hypothetical protein
MRAARHSALAVKRVLLLVPMLGGLSGCSGLFGDKQAEPGEALGTFAVDAKVRTNNCGAGALAAPDDWNFDVKLERATGHLIWDNGQGVAQGTLSAGAFQIASTVTIDMRSGMKQGPPCSVARADSASGSLHETSGTVDGFAGVLSYSFSPTQGSRCDDLVTSTMPTFQHLPCAIVFDMTATKKD